MEGYKTLKAGQDVEFETVKSERGIHAVNIQVVGATESTTEAPTPAAVKEPS
jgi:CspA family cold shock protein